MGKKRMVKWGSVVFVIGIFVVVVGLFFNNNVKIKNVTLSFSDNIKNGIMQSLGPSLTEDRAAKKVLTDGYSFKLVNHASTRKQYVLYLEDIALKKGEIRASDDTVRFVLAENGIPLSSLTFDNVSDGKKKILISSILEPNEVIDYRLLLWKDENASASDSNKRVSSELKLEVREFEKNKSLADSLMEGIPNTYIENDEIDYYFGGERPNNYVWYSGKLWRAVSVNKKDRTVKLITELPITSISFSGNNTNDFQTSYVYNWLNNTDKDGFLGSLYESDKYIVNDASWLYTNKDSLENIVQEVKAPVGLLNAYDYVVVCNIDSDIISYLNIKKYWWLLSQCEDKMCMVSNMDVLSDSLATSTQEVRPSIVMRQDVTVSYGSGSYNDPYHLSGEDIVKNNDLLNTRYSGEYVKYSDILWQIVDTATTKTKITMVQNLYMGDFDVSGSTNYSPTTTIGKYLNETFYNQLYKPFEYIETGTWYLGSVPPGTDYRLSICTDVSCSDTVPTTTANIGLPRIGEMFTSLIDPYGKTSPNFWTLTKGDNDYLRIITNNDKIVRLVGVRPSLYLRENIKIVSGDGTYSSPYIINT